MRLKAITIAGFLILLAALAQGNFQSANARSSIQTLTFIGEDFASGSGAGYTITSEGLTLADAALTAVYTSPTINVPIPFNAIVPEWDDELPEGANLAIEFRTRKGNGSWSRWYAAHDNADWHEDAADHDEKAGDMVIVPANDVTHDWLQFRVSGGRYTHTAPPLLRQLRFVLIDSSAGPTTAQLIAQQEAQNTAESIQPADANSLPRPAVISRSTWCTQPECNYSDGLDYEPVTNLIMHHTVSSGTGDSAAAVRAIWDYHTFSKGWGDIGYNYLIDLNGVVFEGHLNQDYENLDVIGTHSGDANAGGLGTALIGNFTSPDEGSGIMPTSAMLNALADLFAWKADQRGIDPYDATQMVNVNWGLPNIMGHRDVYGGLNTLCPGGNAYSFLPWLRDAVANRIGYVSPYVYVDETSAAFTKSSVSWYEGPAGCGNNGHSYYTWSTTDPNLSTNWATWVLDVPANGRYRIDIYAPYCDTDRGETFGARYTVNHAAGSNNVTLNHETHIGLWMTLGEFDLATSSGSLYLSDLTTTDNGRGVWFDGVRLLLVGDADIPTTVANTAPTPDLWLTNSAVDFTWDIEGPNTILQTMLQVATDAQMSNLIVNQTWASSVEQYTHTFTQDYADLFWQVTAVAQKEDGSSETSVSQVTQFSLDATAPTSTITTVFHVPNQVYYNVAWSGSDNLSGISSYNIQIRAAGDTNWTTWLLNTIQTSAVLYPPDGRVYELRSQATDAAGNIEPEHANADGRTDQAIQLSNGIMLPIIRR